MEKVKKNLSQSCKTIRISPFEKLKTSRKINLKKSENVLTACIGTIVKLPSGKTAVAHGSGLEKIKKQCEMEKQREKIQKLKPLTPIAEFKISDHQKPPKVLTYTLKQILLEFG